MTGTRFGYTLMTEQSGPREIVDYAGAAERAGFDFEVMSDHYFPWLDEQGHAAYAWSMMGAVTQVTDQVELMTYVTCPLMRYHPAVVAQKAAELPGPAGFAGATKFVRPDDVAASIPCGPDVQPIVEAVRPFWEAGFSDVALLQIGDERQHDFLRFAESDLLPALREAAG